MRQYKGEWIETIQIYYQINKTDQRETRQNTNIIE